MTLDFEPDIGFNLLLSSGKRIIIEYPAPEPQVRIAIDETQVNLLWAEGHSEAQVIDVRVGPNGKGWFFTVSAMISLENESVHFRTAAWAATAKLIVEHAEQIEYLCEQDGIMTRKLTDFLDDELSILVLHRTSLPEDLISNTVSIAPQLLARGVFWYVDERTKSLRSPQFDNPGRTWKLKPQQLIGPYSDFIIDLLVYEIPYVESSAFKFFLYFQIIESLMETVSIKIYQETIAEIMANQIDTISGRNIIDKHKEKITDKHRISQVFNNCLTTNLNHSDFLKEKCIDFILSADDTLQRENLEKSQDVARSLYLARNYIIHNYRRAGACIAELAQLTEALDIAVPELLCKFKAPN